jgi:DNA (cytosine-5)-methyltransferase 1
MIAYAKLIARVKPKYFIMENVERARKAEAFTEAINIFRKAGYGITEAVLDASLCGVPQIRKRVFVFGEMGGGNNVLAPIYRNRQAPKPMTLRDYFGKKLTIEHYYRHPRSYARRAVFSLDEPSPTVRGVNRPVPKGYPGHPGDTVPVSSRLRTLTTKERSLIQTFPESWVLDGTKTDLEQVIGNAVPCNLARFVGECIIEYLKKPALYAAMEEEKQLIMFEQKVRYATKQVAPKGRMQKMKASPILPQTPAKKTSCKQVTYVTQKKTKKLRTSARAHA